MGVQDELPRGGESVRVLYMRAIFRNKVRNIPALTICRATDHEATTMPSTTIPASLLWLICSAALAGPGDYSSIANDGGGSSAFGAVAIIGFAVLLYQFRTAVIVFLAAVAVTWGASLAFGDVAGLIIGVSSLAYVLRGKPAKRGNIEKDDDHAS